jgi:hypothetical protein
MRSQSALACLTAFSIAFSDAGMILTAFLHLHKEVERFARDVLPIVRELEIDNGLDPAVRPGPRRRPVRGGAGDRRR